MAPKSDLSPWTSIWIRPRETLQKIISTNPKYCFIFLSAVYGFNMLIQVMQSLSLGQEYSLTGLIAGAVVLSPFIGMLVLSVTAVLIQWTGKWIGGKGNYLAIRAALAWANVPNIVNIILWLILIGYFKKAVFISTFGQTQFTGNELYLVSFIFLLQFVISIWAFIILIKGLAQAQGFSAWKGLFNVLIPFFMLGIAVWLISSLVGAFK